MIIGPKTVLLYLYFCGVFAFAGFAFGCVEHPEKVNGFQGFLCVLFGASWPIVLSFKVFTVLKRRIGF